MNASPVRLVLTVVGAFLLWFVTFAIPVGNFWMKLSASALVLALLGLGSVLNARGRLFQVTVRAIVVGVLSAVLL